MKKSKLLWENYCKGYDMFVIEHIEQDVNDGYLTDDEGNYLKDYVLNITWRMFSFFKDNEDAELSEELEKFDDIVKDILSNRK